MLPPNSYHNHPMSEPRSDSQQSGGSACITGAALSQNVPDALLYLIHDFDFAFDALLTG